MATSLDVLYLTDALGVHDARFTEVLVARGHRVTAAARDAQGWRTSSGTLLTDEDLSGIGADIVQVGPLTLLDDPLPPVEAPVVVTCWGRDAYGDLSPSARAALADAAAVICDCADIAALLIAGGAHRDRIVRFPWGINLDWFPETAQPTGRRRLVSTRALEPFYRHDLVIRAVGRALDDGADIELVLHGEGSDRPRLLELTRSLGIVDRVELVAPIPERALTESFAKATAWVNFAPLDGACISLLQALASGLAVVTTDLPCAREAAGPAPVEFVAVDDGHGLARAIGRVTRPAPSARTETMQWLTAFADWQVNAARYADAIEGAATRRST